MSKKPSLAIVGGGISGLCAAYCLQDSHDITLFEASPDLGGNNHSATIACPLSPSRGLSAGSTALELSLDPADKPRDDGRSEGFKQLPATIDLSIRAPMGVILFPRKALFTNTLSFAEKFSLPLINKRVEHQFFHQGEMQYTSNWQRWTDHINPAHVPTNMKDVWYLTRRFQFEADNHDTKMGAWIKKNKLSESCARYFLLPAAALYLSMPYQDLFELPVSIIARWWKKYCSPLSGLAQYSTLEHGNHTLIDAFVKNTHAIWLTSTPVINVERSETAIKIITADKAYTVDKLIMATRPDEALKLLDNPTKTEKKLLSAITVGEIMSTLHKRPYGCHENAMTLQLHGDTLMQQHVVTTWNQQHFSGQVATPSRYVSIHEVDKQPIEEEDIEHQIKFRIPLPTPSTFSVADPLRLLNQEALNTYYCGSYDNSFFYHEDAISSAMKLSSLLNPIVTTRPQPSSRGLTAGSTVLERSLDPAVKPRDDGRSREAEQLHPIIKPDPGSNA